MTTTDTSLLRTAKFAEAAASVGFGADVGVYLDPQRLVLVRQRRLHRQQQDFARRSKRFATLLERLQEEKAGATKKPASKGSTKAGVSDSIVAEVMRVTDRHKGLEEALQQLKERQTHYQSLSESLGGLAVGVQLQQGAVRAKGFLGWKQPLQPTSWPSALASLGKHPEVFRDIGLKVPRSQLGLALGQGVGQWLVDAANKSLSAAEIPFVEQVLPLLSGHVTAATVGPGTPRGGGAGRQRRCGGQSADRAVRRQRPWPGLDRYPTNDCRCQGRGGE